MNKLIIFILLLIGCVGKKTPAKLISKNNEFQINDSLIHTIHLNDSIAADVLYLNDLISKNNTFVNCFFDIESLKVIDKKVYDEVFDDSLFKKIFIPYYTNYHRQFMFSVYKNELYVNILYTYASNYKLKEKWNKRQSIYCPSNIGESKYCKFSIILNINKNKFGDRYIYFNIGF